MNSDYDITLHSEEKSLAEAARDNFLGSLGLRESDLSEDTGSGSEETFADEGIVLSSQPDGLELPASTVVSSQGRAISFSVSRVPDKNRTFAVSEVGKERSIAPAPSGSIPDSVEKTESFAAVTSTGGDVPMAIDNPDVILNLDCPECGGELVLKRRHIGVEGACVWCHAPIIAVESALDSQVRVVPILGRVIKPASCETPLATTPASASVVDIPAAESGEVNASLLMNSVEDLSASHASVSVGIDSATENTATSPLEDSGEKQVVEPAPREQISPFDLDGLYAAHSFGKPAEDRIEAQGFGETLTSAPAKLAEMPMTGFGAFLQEGSQPKTPDLLTPPLTWPAIRAASPPEAEPTSQTTSLSEPSDALNSVGFSMPAQWGPPVKVAPAEQDSIRDVPGTAFVSGGFGNAVAGTDLGGFTAPGQSPVTAGAASFDGRNAAVNSSAPFVNEPTLKNIASAFAPLGLGAQIGASTPSEKSTGFTGFLGADAPAVANEEARTRVEAGEETTAGLSFHNSPATKLLFGEMPVDDKRTFAMPGSHFSTGSSSEGDRTKQQPSAENPAPLPGKSWGISEPIGTTSGDEAPVAFGRDNQLSPAFGEPMPSAFGDAPFPGFSEAPGSESQVLPTPLRPAVTDFQSGEPVSSALAGPVETRIPNLTSQPLGKKPKVRKGFVVLMVIILGFASGAALASFMLPVDEYVQTARAFMEQKFNSAAVGQQLPSLSPIPSARVEPLTGAIEP